MTNLQLNGPSVNPKFILQMTQNTQKKAFTQVYINN